MDPRTGILEEVAAFHERAALARSLIPVRRDLTAKEKADMQIRLYARCVCGSDKKFKFCCYKKEGA